MWGATALGPAMPASGTADGRKALNARCEREKASYGLLTKHITDLEHVKHMKSNHFQNGFDSFEYYRGACSTPVDRMQIRETWTPNGITSICSPTSVSTKIR